MATRRRRAYRGDITVEGSLAIVPVRPNAFLGVSLTSSTAAQVWRVQRPTPEGISVRGQAPATLDSKRNIAYVGFSDGTLMAVDAEDGTTLWQRIIGNPREFFADVDTQPVLVDGGAAVLAASYNGGLTKLKTDSGEVIYQKPELTRLIALAETAPGRVVATHGDGRVLGLYSDTGAVRWRYRIKRGAPNARWCSRTAMCWSDARRADGHSQGVDRSTGSAARHFVGHVCLTVLSRQLSRGDDQQRTATRLSAGIELRTVAIAQ